MICKKITSFVASIINVIILTFIITNSHAEENSLKEISYDQGVLSLMYHRFNENKYPSTNVKMDIFKKQIEIIKKNKFNFMVPDEFGKNFYTKKNKKKILLTIDDGFASFYEVAWPYLKENKIPFILFISTEPVGKPGYMNWEQIREIESKKFAFLGNHSHKHEYFIDKNYDYFVEDINHSIEIFKKKIGYNPKFFSYPFGEYSLRHKEFIKKKFEFAFGQNSGVIDINKDKYEIPRFPINEKYGDLERFKFLVNLMPLEYDKISIKDNLILAKNNPPKLLIEFFENQKNLDKINCFSDEGSGWKKTDIRLIKNKLVVNFKEKFNFRRGRINCSMRDEEGWRWFGLQFSIK